MKRISTLVCALSLASTLGLAACEFDENTLSEVRTAQDPMTVELLNLPVTVYHTERQWVTGGDCGVLYVGNFGSMTTRPRQCWLEQRTPRSEHIDLTLHFPVGSELALGQTEVVRGIFSNDETSPGEQGYVSLAIKSKFHRYDLRALRRIPVSYDQSNDIEIRLQQ